MGAPQRTGVPPGIWHSNTSAMNEGKQSRIERAALLVLLIPLVYCLYLMTADARLVAARRSDANAIAGMRSRVGIGAIGGLDVFGDSVFRTPPVAPERFVVFLLRRTSIGRDLGFWEAVSAALGAQAQRSVILVGYCDGGACNATVRNLPRPPFPVVAFAEIDDLQTVLDADDKGQFLVLDPRASVVGRYRWRGGGESPETVAKVSEP